MTQPLNYCTQAIENFKGLDFDGICRANFSRLGPADPKITRAVASSAAECSLLMHLAEKFILPPWGNIFERDEIELCADVQIPTRLPYPIVALEYPCPYDDPRCEPMMPQEAPSSKRIALCVETEALHENTPLLAHLHEAHVSEVSGFYVLPIAYSDNTKLWTPPPAGMFFPRGGNEKMKAMQDHGLTAVLPLGFLAYQEYPKEQRSTRVMRDISDEVFAMIHLLTALAIDHGRYETLPAPMKLNKKRAKKNRVPMFEYKVLDIVADILQAAPAAKPHQGGTHASPRMHKRRGHIRHLRSGRTTWVRNMIVGKPTAGTVEKEYSVHE